MFPSSTFGKHCQCQFLFPRCKLCLRYTAGNFNENSSMRAVAKTLRAQASEHSSNVCEQFEHRPNFASTFKLNGTIRYPSKKSPVWTGFIERIHSRVQQPCKIYWNKRKCLHTSSSHWEVSAAVKGVFEFKYDNENFNKNITYFICKMTC